MKKMLYNKSIFLEVTKVKMVQNQLLRCIDESLLIFMMNYLSKSETQKILSSEIREIISMIFLEMARYMWS